MGVVGAGFFGASSGSGSGTACCSKRVIVGDGVDFNSLESLLPRLVSPAPQGPQMVDTHTPMFALRRAVPRAVTVLPKVGASPCRGFASNPALKGVVAGSPAEFSSTDGNLDSYQVSDRGDPTNRTFQYMALGSSKFFYASAGRLAAMKIIGSMSASADVLALSTMEVDLSKIDEGSSITVKWRGKPVFIRHRNDEEIEQALKGDSASLRDPEMDSTRLMGDAKWMVVVGICTHLGCVPYSNAGAYNGWFCPCHGSHYDTSGRIRKGPAPLNLEVPDYKFLEPLKIQVGN